MRCFYLSLHPGAAALVAALFWPATPLLAQSASPDAGPAIAPFARVHPSYVPSQPAPETLPAIKAPALAPQSASSARPESPRRIVSSSDGSWASLENLPLLAAAAGAALLLAVAGFAVGRRSRRAPVVGAIAKTPSCQAVMPSSLAGSPEESLLTPQRLARPTAKGAGKRVKRGRSLDHLRTPAEQPHAVLAARRADGDRPRAARL